MSKHETMTALVVSTGHVTKEEMQLFDKGEAPGEQMGGPMGWDYGCMIYVGRSGNFSDLTPFSDGLRGIIEYAWEHDLQWVRFDCDADSIEGIPTYDW